MDTDKIDAFFKKFNSLPPIEVQKIVESHLDDDCIELIVEHLEELYGIEDDEELGSICQILVLGYMLGSNALN